MSSHVIDVALLILAAYLAGCVIGYAARRTIHANSPDRYMPAIVPPRAPSRPVVETPVTAPQPTIATAPKPPTRPKLSAARRLAMAAADDIGMIDSAPKPVSGAAKKKPGAARSPASKKLL